MNRIPWVRNSCPGLFDSHDPCCMALSAQPSTLPNEAKPFLLPGFEMLDYKQGDLNADKRPDAILILHNPAEDSIFDDYLPRPFLILIRQVDGQLKQVIRNDKAVMGRHDGCVFGDPWHGLNLFENGFSFSFYGGSSWRWAYNYEFRWNAVKKKWLLAIESSSSFNAGDMEATMKSTEIGAAELGEVPIEKFSPGMDSDRGQWKVIAAKTHFYDNPKSGSKPRKGYLVKGNIADGIRRLKNFIEVSYDNGKAVITTGYLLKKDLARIQ